MKKILMLLLLTVVVNGYDVKTYIPKNAYKYLPTLYKTIDEIYPSFILPPYFASLIEQESCINLKHSRCWSPTSQLKTKREQGVGFGQLTRTWHKNGKLRFDKISELRKKHYKYLKDLNWETVKKRPDLQMKAIILLWKSNYERLPKHIDEYNKICMANSAYNAGFGRIRKDRKFCGLRKNCDPNIWFGNLEKHGTLSKRKTIYGRSYFKINRDHVKNVMTIRIWKYINRFYKI